MQKERRTGLNTESRAGRDYRNLAIQFPYFTCRTLRITAHVPVVCRIDDFTAFPVCRRATEFDVFGMSPQQRHGRTSFLTENKVPRWHVRRIPDLLGDETDPARKILHCSHVRLWITTR